MKNDPTDPIEEEKPGAAWRSPVQTPGETSGVVNGSAARSKVNQSTDADSADFNDADFEDIDEINDMAFDLDGELLPSVGAPGEEEDGESRDGDRSSNEDGLPDELPIVGHQDTILLASLSPATLEVQPGASATLQVRLLNNGDRTALFEVLFEGWIDPTWLETNPIYSTVQPGERVSVDVLISPERKASSLAGRRQIVVVVRSPDYPGRESRLVSRLDVLPYDDVQLGAVTPRTTEITWDRRTGRFQALVTNSGNHAVQIRVRGEAEAAEFHFESANSPQAELGPVELSPLEVSPAVAQDLVLSVDPGETAPILGSLRPQRLPLWGMQPRISTFRVLANVVGKPQVPRATAAQMRCQPLIGTRRMALLALLLTFLLTAFTVLGMTSLGLVRIVSSVAPAQGGLSSQPAALPATMEQPIEQPVIAVVVPVDELVPTAADPSSAGPGPIVISVGEGGQDAGIVAASETADVDTGRDQSVPLVGVGEVSSPGAQSMQPATAANPAESTALPPFVPSSAADQSPDRSTLTYAQMFQEIALRYDLDWRMLAAQAYVESRFDTLALGSDGDLGLMQVLPRTWKEWAPAVDVNDPFDAYSNVLVAGVYLDYLRSYLGPSGASEVRWMLVAYNWGPDKLNTFLAEGNDWEALPENLKQYADDILRIAESIPTE